MQFFAIVNVIFLHFRIFLNDLLYHLKNVAIWVCHPVLIRNAVNAKIRELEEQTWIYSKSILRGLGFSRIAL